MLECPLSLEKMLMTYFLSKKDVRQKEYTI